MNYRHAYHAGNFADVLKHSVLALVITHLKLKDTPFRIIDTHAGAGLYDLGGVEAGKTGEWHAGIGRLLSRDAPTLPTPIATLLDPYLSAVRNLNAGGMLVTYPGSPRLALALMRPQDRLIANELHADDALALAAALRRDRRAKILQLDAWIALKSLLPPRERRGVVLIDPPFEQRDELEHLMRGLREATRRFATGTYLLWFPIKDIRKIADFRKTVANEFPLALSVELLVRAPRDPDTLNGCGLLAINPPHSLRAKLDSLVPFLAERLAQARGASGAVTHLGAP
jgi:23S rRNA (adenine2030-N6)-methyltransferase